MNQVRPGTIAMLAGGALLLVSSFLDWQKFDFGIGSFSTNAWDRGLSGFFLFLIAALVIGVAVVVAFAPQVNLPDDVLGFSPNQLAMMLGASAFIFSFCMLFALEGLQIGTILAVASSAAIVVGAYLEEAADSSAPARKI